MVYGYYYCTILSSFLRFKIFQILQNMITYMKRVSCFPPKVLQFMTLNFYQNLESPAHKNQTTEYSKYSIFFSEALFLVSFIEFLFYICFVLLLEEHLLHFQQALSWTGITGKVAKVLAQPLTSCMTLNNSLSFFSLRLNFPTYKMRQLHQMHSKVSSNSIIPFRQSSRLVRMKK